MSEPERTDVYVRLADLPAGAKVSTHEVKGFGLAGCVFLDIDLGGRVVGVEILDATAVEVNGRKVSS